jgi:O-antigen/teichoic acid export membrane protein
MITTPWLLRWLGPERFGGFRVLMDSYAYLGLLEFGLAGALMARLAVAVGRNDHRDTRRFIAAGIRSYLWVTLAMMTAGIGWVTVLPWILRSDAIGTGELRWAGLLLLIGVLLMPFNVFRSLAEARQRGYVVSLLLTGQAALTTIMLVITAWVGWGLIGQSLANIVAQLPFVFLLVWYGLRTYPSVLKERPQRETTRSIWSLNWPTFIFNMSGRIGQLTDNIVIAWVFGPVAVVPFFLTQRLSTIALGQIQGIGNSTWAGLAELHSQGRADVFRLRLAELTGVVSSLGICVLAPIAAYNLYFISHWVGSSNFAGESVTVLACINAWLWAIYGLWGWPLSGTGNIGSWVPYAVLGTVINLIISVTGALAFGWIGPLLGTLATFLLINSWAMPHVLKQIFQTSSWGMWRSALAPLVWGVPYALSVWFIARSHVPTGWSGLITEMGFAVVCGLVFWWNISLSRRDRLVWIARVQEALAR